MTDLKKSRRPGSIIAGITILAASVAVLSMAHFACARAADGQNSFIGSWRGTFHPVTKEQSSETLTLEFKVAPDLNVTGHIGGAQLANAKLQRHPWAYRKVFGHKTEYNIQGELKGSILSHGDRGWNRIYIHLRHDATQTTKPICAPIVSIDWGKHGMMPMTMLSFGQKTSTGSERATETTSSKVSDKPTARRK